MLNLFYRHMLFNLVILFYTFFDNLRDNTVTSCRKCNGRKGWLRPAQLHKVGMASQSKPRCRSLYELAATANKFVPRRVHPTWAPFLGIDMENTDTIKPFSRGGGPSLPRP